MRVTAMDVLLEDRRYKKASWIPLPKEDPDIFGFRGNGAEVSAKRMSRAVEQSVAVIRQKAAEIWESVTTALVNAGMVVDRKVSSIINSALQEMDNLSKKVWTYLLHILHQCESVDQIPVRSRTAISEPLRQMYLSLADKVDQYVSSQIRTKYVLLSNESEKFIHQ